MTHFQYTKIKIKFIIILLNTFKYDAVVQFFDERLNTIDVNGGVMKIMNKLMCTNHYEVHKSDVPLPYHITEQ